MKILLIEPSFFGMGYFAAAQRLNIKIIVLTNDLKNQDTFGYRKNYIDLFKLDLNDQSAVFATVDRLMSVHQVTAVLPGSQLATTIAGAIGERFGLLGLDKKSALLGVNKDFARNVYRDKQIPSAKFALINEQTDFYDITSQVPFPLVLKPVASSSSKAVELINDTEALKSRFEALRDVDTSFMGFDNRQLFMVEELLQGHEYSVELALNEGKIFFNSVTEKLKTALPYFVELGHISPAAITAALGYDLVDVSVKACMALGLSTGIFHVELINSIDGPRIVEINPRPAGDKITSHLLPLSHRIDLYELHLKILCGEAEKQLKCDNKVAAIFFMTANQEGRVIDISVADTLSQHSDIIELELYVKAGDKVCKPTSSADRIGHFIVRGETHKAVVELKKIIDAAIRIRIG